MSPSQEQRDRRQDASESDAAAIDQLRTLVGTEISHSMTDSDCTRFLRARPESPLKAAEMAQKWFVWRSTLMTPLPPCQLAYSPNIMLANPHPPENNPHINLIKAAHFGFDRDGRPVYWEKTGTMQCNFDEIFKYFTIEDLVQLHVYSQELFELRLKQSSLRRGAEVTNEIVVFDMTNLTMVLNLQSITYMKEVLAIDQNYYPERLHRLFIINCPWYFSAIYNIFKPFIDKRTRDKFVILGYDYLSVLLEYIDVSQIPSDFGGDAKDVPWCLRGTDDAGSSQEIVRKHVRDAFAPDKVRELLTEEEIESLNTAFKVADDILSASDENAMLAEEAMLYHSSLGDRQEVMHDDGTTRPLSTLSPGHSAHLHVPMPHVRARMVKAENSSTHHVYLLVVEYGDSGSWPIRRRYSDFVKFRDKLKNMANDLMWPKLPPKTLFKKSMSVVSVRLIGLDFFLSTVIDRVSRLQIEDFVTPSASASTSDSFSSLASVRSGQRRRSAANYWRESLLGMNPITQAKLRQQLRVALLEFLEVSKHHPHSVSSGAAHDPRRTSFSHLGSGPRSPDATAQASPIGAGPVDPRTGAAASHPSNRSSREPKSYYVSAFTFSVLALLVGIFVGNFYTIMSVFGKSFLEDSDEIDVDIGTYEAD